MNILKRFVSGLGAQTAPFGFAPDDPEASYKAGLGYIGDIGANLLANNQGGVNPWANLGASMQQAKQSSVTRNKEAYTAQRLMEEAAAKKAEREAEAQRKQQMEDAIAQLPPEQQALARMVPEKFFGAQVDGMFGTPEQPKRYSVGGALVDADGNVIYQGDVGGGDESPNWGMSVVPLRNKRDGTFAPGQFNQKTGGVFINGEPADPSMWEYDPGAVAQDKAAGTAMGTQMGGAASEIPAAQIDTNAMNAKIDMLINNPNLEDAIGYGNVLTDYLVSNDTLSIRSQLNELEGGTFMSAYSALKGGGQITEIESAQAKQAIADIQTARKMDDKDKFVDALTRLRDAVNRGMAKLRAKAGPYAPQGEQAPSAAGENDPLGLR